MATCEEAPLDTAKALKESRILVISGIQYDCSVIKSLVSVGFRDIEIVTEGEISKSEAEATENSAKSKPDVRVKVHTSHVMDYSANFFKRFTVVFSTADGADVKNYAKQTCSAVDVPLVEKESVQLSENVIKEKFKTEPRKTMEILAVYYVLQNYGKKQTPEMILSRTNQDEFDPVKDLTEALKRNMEIMQRNSMALDKYTATLAELPQQVERSLNNQTDRIIKELHEILRELSTKS